MIVLVTGQPGAGKTLFTLFQVNSLSLKENRQVYYSGIGNLNLPWIELDNPEDWFKCPAGSIIVIDECQRVFRPRMTGSTVPEYVARFETHRHQGLDIFLITQHPMLLDSNIRRLVGRHNHVMRAFGGNAANVHEWAEVRETPDKNRSGSMTTFWKYPKEVFSWYKSAELHTHKLRIPPRLFFLFLAPFLIGACVYALYSWWKPKIDGSAKPVLSASRSSAGAAEDKLSSGSKSRDDYLVERVPRISGLLHTAPVYDRITEPQDAPVPVGCVSTTTKCRCIDQQGADYATDDGTCRHIIKHGIFIAWRKPVDLDNQSAESRRPERTEVAQLGPEVHQPVNSAAVR